MSPTLSNIYLSKLDAFTETVLIPQYTRGGRRKETPSTEKEHYRLTQARREGDRARAPAMLIMDQKVTNQAVLGELDARGIKFLTLRMRSPALVRHINALTPARPRQQAESPRRP